MLTRPLGASFADRLGKPASIGGVGFGDGPITLVAVALIAVLVAVTVRTGRDAQQRDPARRPAVVQEG